MYLIEFRSTDRTGNVEAAKSVSFTIAVADNCLTNFNDEFNGTALDPKWSVLRPLPDAVSFVDGAMRIKVRNGDMIGNQATAQNVLLQDAPSGSWQIQTKLDVSTLVNEGEQAGFILWQGENPNTFAKITYISKGTFSQYEWVATRNGTIADLGRPADLHAGRRRLAAGQRTTAPAPTSPRARSTARTGSRSPVTSPISATPRR